MAEAIKIEGLTEFTRNLKALDAGLPKALRVALNDAANVVVDYARPRIPSRSGRARRSVRAKSTRDRVRVAGGGKRAAYYPWLDFGGRVGRRKAVKRAFLKEGRYIYAGYFAERDKFERVLTGALLDTARSAGIEVD